MKASIIEKSSIQKKKLSVQNPYEFTNIRCKLLSKLNQLKETKKTFASHSTKKKLTANTANPTYLIFNS